MSEIKSRVIALAEINEFKTERVGFIENDAQEHFYLRMDPVGVDGVTRIGWYSTLMALSGAKSVNLWHQLHSGGSTLIRDLDQVIVLEKLLQARGTQDGHESANEASFSPEAKA